MKKIEELIAMVKSISARLLVTVINLLLPGSGLAAAGHIKSAWGVIIGITSWVVILCWTRYILKPEGAWLFLAGILSIWCISTSLCFMLTPHINRKVIFHSAAVALCTLVLIFSLFQYKQQLLGIQIYFIPSMSMYPELKPGQFVLADSWAYTQKPPKPDDIIVFHDNNDQQILVKRIAHWPDGSLISDGHWFVLGDHRPYSIDSRHFGGITEQQIIGRVIMVLLRVDQQGIVSDSYLRLVN